MRAKLVVILIALFFCTTVAFGAEWWEEEQTGQSTPTKKAQSFKGPAGSMTKTLINWEEGYIEAVGMATVDLTKPQNAYEAAVTTTGGGCGMSVAEQSPKIKSKVHAELMAQEGACTMAYAKLAEMLNGVVVNAHTTVVDMMTSDVYANTATRAVIKGARRIEERVIWDSGAPKGICRIGIVLKGTKGIQVPAYEWAMRNKVEGQIPMFKPSEAAQVSTGTYSGVVIDARGYSFEPSMLPQVYTEDGKLVYGASTVDPQVAKQQGLAGFATDLNSQSALKRVGNNPLVIKAQGLYGNKNAGVKINSADALKAFGEKFGGGLLKMAKLLFLL